MNGVAPIASQLSSFSRTATKTVTSSRPVFFIGHCIEEEIQTPRQLDRDISAKRLASKRPLGDRDVTISINSRADPLTLPGAVKSVTAKNQLLMDKNYDVLVLNKKFSTEEEIGFIRLKNALKKYDLPLADDISYSELLFAATYYLNSTGSMKTSPVTVTRYLLHFINNFLSFDVVVDSRDSIEKYLSELSGVLSKSLVDPDKLKQTKLTDVLHLATEFLEDEQRLEHQWRLLNTEHASNFEPAAKKPKSNIEKFESLLKKAWRS